MKTLRKALSLFLTAVLAVSAVFCCSVPAAAKNTVYASGSFNEDGDYELQFPTMTTEDMRTAANAIQHDGMASAVAIILFTGSGKVGDEVCGFMTVYEENGDYSMPVIVSKSILSTYSENMGLKNVNEKIFKNIEPWKTSDGVYGMSFLFDGKMLSESPFFAMLKDCTTAYTAVCKYDGTMLYDLYEKQVSYVSIPTYLSFTDNNTRPDKTESSLISSLTIGKLSDMTYSGKALKPEPVITDGTRTLTKSIDYKLSYNNNKSVGTATVTVTGINMYSGTRTLTFRILPKKTSLTVKKSGSKYKLSWKAVSGIDKYQIQRSSDGGKTYINSGTVAGTKTSCTVKPPEGKTYRFRIRSYKEVDGKKYYSAWSYPSAE